LTEHMLDAKMSNNFIHTRSSANQQFMRRTAHCWLFTGNAGMVQFNMTRIAPLPRLHSVLH